MYNFSIILLTAISGTGNYRKKAQPRHDKNLPMKPFKHRLHVGTLKVIWKEDNAECFETMYVLYAEIKLNV